MNGKMPFKMAAQALAVHRGLERAAADAKERGALGELTTGELIGRLGAAIARYDKLAARPVREWVPSGGVCPPDCDEPCEFHGGAQPCRSGKLVEVAGTSQADGGTGLCGGDCVLPAGHNGGCSSVPRKVEVETASEHVRNALQILRTAAAAVEYVPGYLQLHESDVAAIDRRLTAALNLIETVDAARVAVSGVSVRQRTVETMLDQIVEALGLDNTDWHISDVLKSIAALQAPARGRRS